MAKIVRRGPRTAGSAAPRSLLASGVFHATLLGAGVLWGVLVPGGKPLERRAYLAHFAPLEAERVPEERERLDPIEPPEASEPELRESEVWALPEREIEPVPEVTRALDWIAERPFDIGSLEAPKVAAAEPEPVAPQPASSRIDVLAAPAPVEFPQAAPVVPVPVVIEPVPRLAPAPAYPRLSRRAGEEGSVLCRLQLTATGQVVEVVLVESSGFERLDRAAVEALSDWSFEPRREDGRAVAASLLHRVTFRLGTS